MASESPAGGLVQKLQTAVRKGQKDLTLFALLAVICIFLAWKNPQALSTYNLQNTARLIGMFGILSLGVSVVVLTGGIDLSVGSACAVLGVILVLALTEWGWPPAIALPAVVLFSAGLGWLNGMLVTRVKLQPFIVTLCGLLIYRGAARFITRDSTKGLGEAKGFEGVKAFLTSSPYGVPISFVLFLVTALVIGIVIHKTVYGRRLFALGKNAEAARYAGVNVTGVEAGAYVIAGVCTGIAAILFTFYTNSVAPSTYGSYYELFGVAGAVLGGFSLRGGEGSIIGAILGTAILQVLQNLVNLLGIDSSLNFAVLGVVILIGVLIERVFSAFKDRGSKKPSAAG